MSTPKTITIEELQDENALLLAALRQLAAPVGDAIRGFRAHQKIVSGFNGMGANILHEDVGYYHSPGHWNKIAQAYLSTQTLLEQAYKQGK